MNKMTIPVLGSLALLSAGLLYRLYNQRAKKALANGQQHLKANQHKMRQVLHHASTTAGTL